MTESTVTFEADAIGGTPKGWTATKTGRGDPRWTIEQDQTAPSKSKIVKQSGTATYPLLLKDDTQIQDGFIEVMFKAVAGSEDRAAGIVWRARDANNYYVVPDRVRQRRKIGLVQLLSPARKDKGDLARALIDERNLLLDNDVAEPVQLRCQSFRFSRQRLKLDLGRNDAVDGNQKGGACERRSPLCDELTDLDLLIHREKFGFCGGARWGLSRGCGDNYIYAGHKRQNASHHGPLEASRTGRSFSTQPSWHVFQSTRRRRPEPPSSKGDPAEGQFWWWRRVNPETCSRSQVISNVLD